MNSLNSIMAQQVKKLKMTPSQKRRYQRRRSKKAAIEKKQEKKEKLSQLTLSLPENIEGFSFTNDFFDDFYFGGGASPVDSQESTDSDTLETAEKNVCEEVLKSFTTNGEELIGELVDAATAIVSDEQKNDIMNDVNEIKINFDPCVDSNTTDYFTNDQASYDYYNADGAIMDAPSCETHDQQVYPEPQPLPPLDDAYSPRISGTFDTASQCSTPCFTPRRTFDTSMSATPMTPAPDSPTPDQVFPPTMIGSASPRTQPMYENEPAMMVDPKQQRYDCMTVQQLRDHKLMMEELIDYRLVARFAYDKIGCHYMQQKLKRASDETCHDLITSVLDSFVRQRIDMVRMAEDVYGNYFLQIVAERGSVVHHQIMLNYFVYGSVLRLSRSQCGCRVLQNLIYSIAEEGQLCELAECMKDQLKHGNQYETIDALMVNCNSAHVLQALVDVGTSFENIEFIADELNRNLAYYAEDTYACRVIQSIINQHGNKLDFDQLFVNGNHFNLSLTRYGNYVIQCIVEKGKWYSEKPAFKAFRNQLIEEVFVADAILDLSRDKHGSHMIETCLKSANKAQIQAFIDAVCATKAFVLRKMLKDKFGNFVPKTLMNQCTKKQQREVVESVHAYIGNLYRQFGENQFFNLNREFFHQCQAVKYNMDGRHYCSYY